MTTGALCGVDGFTAHWVCGERSQLDEPASLVWLAFHPVLREPVDIGDHLLHLYAVLGHGTSCLAAGKALLNPVLQGDRVSGALVEHGEESGEIGHGGSIGGGAALNVAVAAGKSVAYITAGVFGSFIEDQ